MAAAVLLLNIGTHRHLGRDVVWAVHLNGPGLHSDHLCEHLGPQRSPGHMARVVPISQIIRCSRANRLPLFHPPLQMLPALDVSHTDGETVLSRLGRNFATLVALFATGFAGEMPVPSNAASSRFWIWQFLTFLGMVYRLFAMAMVFRRLMSPAAKVIFSKWAIVTDTGLTQARSLEFRITTSILPHEIMQANVQVVAAISPRTGPPRRRYYPLELVSSFHTVMPYIWTGERRCSGKDGVTCHPAPAVPLSACSSGTKALTCASDSNRARRANPPPARAVSHVIDKASPLYGESWQNLATQNLTLLVLYTGIEGATMEEICVTHTYKIGHLLFDGSFLSLLSDKAKPYEDKEIVLDFRYCMPTGHLTVRHAGVAAASWSLALPQPRSLTLAEALVTHLAASCIPATSQQVPSCPRAETRQPQRGVAVLATVLKGWAFTSCASKSSPDGCVARMAERWCAVVCAAE